MHEVAFGPLLQLLRSESVQRFGRLHDDPIRARQRQASETRQGTKSRRWSTELAAARERSW